MPNQISQIQVGGVTYNICDTTARNTVENMKTVNNISLLGSGNISVGVTGIKGSAEDSYQTGEVTLTPSNLGIGTFYSANSTTTITNTSIDSYTNGASLTLSAGSYIITGSWEFPSAPTDGTRVCQAAFKPASSSYAFGGSRNRVVEGGNNYATVRTALAYSFNTTTTVYIAGSSNKATGTPAHENTFIEAIKIA